MGLLSGTTIVEGASTQMRVEYDANNAPLYVGTAPMGALASEAKWNIQKFTNNAAGGVILRQIKRDGVWDNRGAETYA